MTMPTFGYYIRQPQDIDPRRWARCLRDAEASMVAEGRHPRTLCHAVKRKRAFRLWAAGR